LQVFYYVDKYSNTMPNYYHLGYQLVNGTQAFFRVTKEHNLFVAAYPTSQATSPPPSTPTRVDTAVVGDLIVVKDEFSGLFYTTPLTIIKRGFLRGAYTPLLTGGGLLVADGVVVYTTGHEPKFTHNPSVNHPLKQLGDYYGRAAVWQRFLAGDASDCTSTPGSCPCLDDACTKQGDKLSDLADGFSPFHRLVRVARQASNVLVQDDYAGMIREARSAIAAGKVYSQKESLALYERHRKFLSGAQYFPASGNGSSTQTCSLRAIEGLATPFAAASLAKES